MKPIHIVGILVILGGIAMLIATSGDMSTYSTFTKAENTGKRAKIIGVLVKDKEITYDPEIDPNYFSFYIQDDEERIEKVVFNQPKPQDFELSEKVVLTGKMRQDHFYADEILLKCPSKYKDEEITLRSGSK